MITSVDALLLIVKDLDRCAAFYGDQLGLKVKARETGTVSFQLGLQDLTLMSFDYAEKRSSAGLVGPTKSAAHRTVFSVFVDDADKEYTSLKANGVKFVRPPTTNAAGQRIATFSDPEGNLWEISHFVVSA